LVLATMSLVVSGVLMLTFLPAAWLLVAILDRRR
jgi:hypothetical protein